MYTGMPICYVKSTVLCIDDDISITNALYELVSKHYPTICFNKITELLEYLENYESIINQNKLFREFSESEYANLPTSSLVHSNLKNLYDLINIPDIIQEIALIIVDNAMPDMNGLLLCEKLKNYPFEKMIYTGTDDYKSGIAAMNAHTIGNFISKSSSSEMLMNKIEEFTFKYFYDIANLI